MSRSAVGPHTRRNRRLVAAPLGLAVLAGALVAGAAPAAAAQLGPKPGKCGIGCWGDSVNGQRQLAVSFIADFNITPPIVREGQRIRGKVTVFREDLLTGYTWPFPFSGRRARGRQTGVLGSCGPNNRACFARAGKPTNRWITVGMGWSNPINTARSDSVYAIIGRNRSLIQGYVRDRDGSGVGGIRVTIRKQGQRRGAVVTTSADGFYNRQVTPGKYAVQPKLRRGRRDRYTVVRPGSQRNRRLAVVKVPRARTVDVDWKLNKGLKVTIKAAQQTIAANGLAQTELTIRARRDGEPVARENIQVSQVLSRGNAPGAENVTTPALICEASSRVWPSDLRGSAGNSLPGGVRTDADGNVKLLLRAGTKPGTIRVEAVGADALGVARTRNSTEISDRVSVNLAAIGNGNVADLPSTLNFIGNQDRVVFRNSPTLATQLADLAAGGFSSATNLRGLAFSPIQRGSDSAVLVTDADTPPTLGEDGNTVTASSGVVVSPQRLAPIAGLVGGFNGVLAANRLPEFPAYTNWLNGPQPGWTYTGSGPAVSGARQGAWNYNGWPYPTTTRGVCSG